MASLAVALALPAGCSTGKPRPAKIKSEYVQPDTSGATIYLSPAKHETRIVDTRSYVLGARTSAGVGEPVAAVRRYMAGDRAVRAVAVRDVKQWCGTRRSSGSSRALPRGEAREEPTPATELRPCTSGPLAYFDIAAGRILPVAGGFEEGGKNYYLLAIPTPDGTLFIATDTDGYLKSDRYAAWRDAGEETVVTQVGIPLKVLAVSDPMMLSTPIVRYETEETVVAESPEYVHFELLYAGTSQDYRGRVWHMLYKEYRRNPVGTPIYTKRLDYAEVGSTIQLLGLRLHVHEATASRLVYTIVED